ncbi:MAG: NAD(P)-dependent oxidoreductase [Alphaproteobacteria bacterium]|nr:NAD(P)-dependent oxidoreductase [Alphaproteobacteria bacterium]
MPTGMLKFVKQPRVTPDKREAEARRHDFGEIYVEYDPARAAEQASRCSQCGIPFCQNHCPLHNNIPDWLMLASAGRLEEAYELSSATNNMPEICGRICPQDRLCEGNCVIEQSGHGTVTIGAVEKYITEVAWQKGWVKGPAPREERGQSIGVIGGGPAGMAAAEELRRRGYAVDVYERHDRVGGLLVYGIPNFKLEKSVVARRVELLEKSGIRFHVNFEVGRDASLAELRQRHDAILIATGVYQALELGVPGVGLGNVVQALDYLIASNRTGLGDSVPAFESGLLDAAGKRIVVIGGGDTAMDCVRTAVRQGAASVRCLYRRDRGNMPGSQREVRHAEEEGVEFMWLSQPEALLGDDNVRAVRALRTHLGVADPSGRQPPVPVEGSQFPVDADLVIKALGFEPEDLRGAFASPELAITRRGTVRVEFSSMMTNLDGVFAAGDITRGASLVVWAIRDGREAAAGIHAYLEAKTAARPDANTRAVA